MHHEKILRPDSKGRICLGRQTKGISGYRIKTDAKTHEITLIPYVDIPLSEQWLYENEVAFKKVKKGLQQSAEGKTTSKGSFSQYVKDES